MNVLRAKGFAWLATRMQVRAVFAHAGRRCDVVQGPPWYAAVSESQWPAGFEDRIKRTFNGQYGDRGQEIIIIGQNMNVQEIKNALGQFLSNQIMRCLKFTKFLNLSVVDCLLTDAEFNKGEEAWSKYPDPYKPFFEQAHNHMHLQDDGHIHIH